MEPIALMACVREDHDRWLELAADPPMAAPCVNRAAARMLEQCRIPHVLHVSVAEVDGSCRLRYRIAHRQPLSDAVGGASWHAGRAMRLLFKLCEALENSTQYLLKPDGFVLRPEYVFVGVDDDDLGLVYVPVSAVDGRKEARLAFAELCDWLAAQPGNKQDGRLQAIAGWSREPTWSISLMKKRIGRAWMGEEGVDAGRDVGGEPSGFAAGAMAADSGPGSGALSGFGRSGAAGVASVLKSAGEGMATATAGASVLSDRMTGPAAAVRAAIRSLPPAVWLVAAVAVALAGWKLDQLHLAAGGAATAIAAWAGSAWLRRRTARTGPGEQAGGREVPPQLARDAARGAGAAATHAPAVGWPGRVVPMPPDGWGDELAVDEHGLPDGWSAGLEAEQWEPSAHGAAGLAVDQGPLRDWAVGLAVDQGMSRDRGAGLAADHREPSIHGAGLAVDQGMQNGWSTALAAERHELQREPATAAASDGRWPGQHPPSAREAAAPAQRFGNAAESYASVASAATTPLPSPSADATVWLGAGRGRGAAAPDSYHGIVQIRKGDERQRLPWVGEPRFVLGRGPDGVHYRDDSLGVSRQHIELVREGDSICARDLDSVNGTLLNGEWMEPQRAYPLKDGDVLQMLRTEIVYRK